MIDSIKTYKILIHQHLMSLLIKINKQYLKESKIIPFAQIITVIYLELKHKDLI